MSVLIAFLSLIAERLIGYPDRLFAAIGHPVTWLGRLIAFLDRTLNRPTDSDFRRRMSGVLALVIIVAIPVLAGFAIQRFLGEIAGGFLLTALLATSLLAQKSLHEHVRAVAHALDTGGVEAGRKAVALIVGRDPEQLDEAAVCRAAIESLAENFSDGVVAPALWLGIGGLAGGAGYKAVNTADSMIGHKSPRHRAFGWAAARLDDLVNLPASRLSALLIVLSAALMKDADPAAAWRAVRRDAGRHRSPNAGWPEAAVAGALGLALAGPRIYGGETIEDAFMGNGRYQANSGDIRRALALCRIADLLLILLFGGLAGLILLI